MKFESSPRSISPQLFDRKMAVRLDKQPGMTPEELAQLPNRLPEGLVGVGMGLGANGNPLTEVAKNISSSQVCVLTIFLLPPSYFGSK